MPYLLSTGLLLCTAKPVIEAFLDYSIEAIYRYVQSIML